MNKLIIILIIATLGIVFAHRGKQVTIWNPEFTGANNVNSYKPCNFRPDNENATVFRREYLFTPALSQGEDTEPYDTSISYVAPKDIERSNVELYTKLSHLWKNLGRNLALPGDQCYTVYLDVRSTAGDLTVGVSSRVLNVDAADYNYTDNFVGFTRFNETSSGSPGNFVQGTINGTTDEPTIDLFEPSNLCTGGCPSGRVENFRLAIEICNTTTIEFVETTPLGVNLTDAAQGPLYGRSSAIFNVDLRGSGDPEQSIDVVLIGSEGVDVFVVAAKSLPTPFGIEGIQDTRNQFSVVMDGAQLDPNQFDADWGQSDGAFESDDCSGSVNFDQKDPKTSETEEFLELTCMKLPEGVIRPDIDYLIDVGLFAESSPIEESDYHSIVVGIKSGSQFVGFNRVGFANDRLGDVVTATASDTGLRKVKRTENKYQSKPSDGTVHSSSMSAPLFNVKFSIYGKDCAGDQPGVSVFAGTPDCPPYTYVWDALGQIPFYWQGDLELCVYQKANYTIDCIPENDDLDSEALPQSTKVNGLTFSIEQADYGCDGRDLSGLVKDSCGVCNGNNDCLGCDNKPHSNVVEDACGRCGGDNSTCCNYRSGIESHIWDWLLIPHIIDDVIERLGNINDQLQSSCDLLGKYNNLCDKNSEIFDAFSTINFKNFIDENRNWKEQCFFDLSRCISQMERNLTAYVTI